MMVTIPFEGDDDEVTFLLASREESGAPIDVYSPRSPLGVAINGQKVGETASYNLPNGRAATVEILEAVPYGGMYEPPGPGPGARASSPNSGSACGPASPGARSGRAAGSP